MRYKIWNRQDSLITPIGEIFTAEEIFQQYPASRLEHIKYIICDSIVSMGVFMEFESTKEHYTQLGVPITEGMSDQEVLDAISYWEENPPPSVPSPEERIASSLEFQSMMMLPLEEEK